MIECSRLPRRRCFMTKRELLRDSNFGSQVAEEEHDLESYFVETEHWRRIYQGETDIVYGPKGSGKSAIYLLLVSRDDLLERGVLVVPAENPRGALAFSDIVDDPPTTEAEFRGLWKLYFLSLVGDVLEDWGITNDGAQSVVDALAEAGLREPRRDLRGTLKRVAEYARSALRVGSIEAGAQIDPVTGIAGVHGKITFGEPSPERRAAGHVSVDSLLSTADTALDAQDFEVWLTLDRLDVAFAEERALEENALRALFRVYIDLLEFDNIRLKIFLRDDIWERIISSGFREASHINRDLTLTWDDTSLLNLLIRRALSNSDICDYYGVIPEDVLADIDQQRKLFYRIFPEQVERGARKSTTLTWMVGRTRDGTGRTAPRELIHLVEAARQQQLRSLELGEDEPRDETLITGTAIKAGLPEVSQARLQRTLYAEYPEYKQWVEKLEGGKTLQTDRTLSKLWGVDESEAASRAQQLVEIGFFEQRGAGEHPSYWVPFLYRDSLNMVQGSAEQETAR